MKSNKVLHRFGYQVDVKPEYASWPTIHAWLNRCSFDTHVVYNNGGNMPVTIEFESEQVAQVFVRIFREYLYEV